MTTTLAGKMSHVADVHSASGSYVASAFTVIAGLTINEWVAVCGLILAGLTFGVNWYYRHKHYKLAKEGKK